MSNKSKQYIFTGGVIIALLLVIYGFTINQKTEVLVELPIEGSQIIINRENLIIPEEKNISLKLDDGQNEIIVNKEGYFPWTTTLSIESEEKIILKPFLVSQSPSGQIITENDREYFELIQKIENKKVPTKDNPLKLENVSVWVGDGNEIIFKNEEVEKVVIKPLLQIRSVEFYKEREDVLIFGTEDGIYAIDVYGEGNQQNFMPIYKGSNPRFILGESQDFLYISDVNSLMIVMI